MYLVAIAWIYVVVLMALAEATSGGTVLGALSILLFYGALPLGITLYVLATPARRRGRRRAALVSAAARAGDPDRGAHPAGDAVAPVGKEP